MIRLFSPYYLVTNFTRFRTKGFLSVHNGEPGTLFLVKYHPFKKVFFVREGKIQNGRFVEKLNYYSRIDTFEFYCDKQKVTL